MCPNIKETIPNLINPATNEPTTTGFEKADRPNDFCVRQTKIDVDDNSSGPFDDVQDANNIHRIYEIRLNDIEVKDVLLFLDPGKATGSDGISNIILRECTSELASPLCDIFNASLSSSTVSFSWKQCWC